MEGYIPKAISDDVVDTPHPHPDISHIVDDVFPAPDVMEGHVAYISNGCTLPYPYPEVM